MSAAPGVPTGPERTCVGCRMVRPKRELIRIVLPAEGPAALDPTGKRNGRGAYLCRQTGTTCLAQARRRRVLVRALRTTSDRIDWDSLAAELDVPLEVLTSQR
jgi:uncharacterized protein